MAEPMVSQRLTLRRFELDDAAVFADYRSDPAVARFQGWDAPFAVAAARRLTAEFARADQDAVGWFQWAIEVNGQPGIIGDVGVNRLEDGRQAVIGYTLATAYQGQGFATEAVSLVLDRLLVEEELHRVSAECDTRNLASVRLLERVGFRREGHSLESTWADGKWSDDYLYALLAHEWKGHDRRTGAQR